MNREIPLKAVDIAILGMGLMGGSLAMALRGRCRSLAAYDPDQETVSNVQKSGVVDFVSIDPSEVVMDANLIVLAAPVSGILDLLGRLPGWKEGPAVVMDLGSTKRHILEAMMALPERFDPIGGHPMCGKAVLGFENAEPGIYRDASFGLVPLARSSTSARKLAVEVVRIAGAHPVWMDAETHDRLAASTSHLPFLIASALTLSTPAEAADLIGPGFQSATRLASTPSGMMMDVLRSNRDEVLDSIGRFRAQLDMLQIYLLNGEDENLKRALDRAANHLQAIKSAAEKGRTAE